MNTLCFATNNRHKLREIQEILGNRFRLLTLEEIGCTEEIPEPYETISENSRGKAGYVWEKYGCNNFADDSGLVIPALNGEPGVHSAYYAGPQRDAGDNIRLVLDKLKGKADRRAYFITVITLVIDGQFHSFEGRVDGEIIHEARGNNGFSYDPIFIPEGSEKTFAEMTSAEKASVSHRARAFTRLISFLTPLTGQQDGTLQQ